jgi:hypothetical protein
VAGPCYPKGHPRVIFGCSCSNAADSTPARAAPSSYSRSQAVVCAGAWIRPLLPTGGHQAAASERGPWKRTNGSVPLARNRSATSRSWCRAALSPSACSSRMHRGSSSPASAGSESLPPGGRSRRCSDHILRVAADARACVSGIPYPVERVLPKGLDSMPVSCFLRRFLRRIRPKVLGRLSAMF